MRQARDDHRRLEGQAIAAAERALGKGDEQGARNASQSAGIHSDRALKLNQAILAAEREEAVEGARLGEEALQLQAALLRAVFAAIEVPLPVALLRELAGRAVAGEALEAAAGIVGEAREEVHRAIRGQLRRKLEGEVRAQIVAESRADSDAAEGEGDRQGVDGEGGAAWDPTPGTWRAAPGGRQEEQEGAGQRRRPSGTWERPGDPGDAPPKPAPLPPPGSLGSERVVGVSLSLQRNREVLREGVPVHRQTPQRRGRPREGRFDELRHPGQKGWDR